ncbi:hypothetical protein ACGP04_01410 [Piscirickettsia salmonis]|uniref:hypothetical protein n=1 Tax=Piscirickettsia salmonis TaxID=1238 RepID=UPI000F07F5CE|nr:hypothetical protein DA717_10360 [Piscirickettsiaceae bacterium NZ-RLO2]
MYLDIYFDGTGVNLNSPTEEKFGKSVVGYAFLTNPAAEIFVDSKDNSKLGVRADDDDTSRNPYEPEHVKIYFPGPAAKPCTYQGQHYPRPAATYNPTQIPSLLLSQHTTTNRTGAKGDGWEHNLQHAIIVTLNFILTRRQYNPTEPIIIRIPAAYSRGGITAIAFSNQLSELLDEMGIPQNQIFIEEMHLIDPVAGQDYGKFQNAAKRHDYKRDLRQVDPTRIGKRVHKVSWYNATQEKRGAFTDQAPGDFSTGRAILVPDNVECKRHYLHACHKSIGHPDRKGVLHAAGAWVYQQATGAEFPVPDGIEASWIHMADEFYPSKRNRSFSDAVSEESPIKSEHYTNSILYDVFHSFMYGCPDKVTFEQALKEPRYHFNPILTWAYKNSNFFRITGLAIDDLSSEVIAQAVQCQSRLDLALFAICYNQDPSAEHYAIATGTHVDHQTLEAIITAPAEEQAAFLAEHLHPVTGAAKDRQEADKAVNNAIARLRASSFEKKMPPLTLAKEQISQATDKDSCAEALAQAEAVTRHPTAKFANRYSKYDSKDYRATDFQKAKEHLQAPASGQQHEHHAYNQTHLAFDQFSEQEVHQPPSSVRLLAYVELEPR